MFVEWLNSFSILFYFYKWTHSQFIKELQLILIFQSWVLQKWALDGRKRYIIIYINSKVSFIKK